MSGMRKLGRGLAALMGDEEPMSGGDGSPLPQRTLAIHLLQPGRYQPRKRFDEAGMEALVSSVRIQGVLQPLLVRQLEGEGERYEIIAGERRWRAAQRAQLHDVPVVIREMSDRDALEIALVENLQREDLTALEEAEAYRRLVDEFGHTQEELARAVGKSRSHIANTLRLLTLPEPVQEMVQTGRLTAGHARALVGSDDAVDLAKLIADKGLTVRDAERLASQAKPPRAAAKLATLPGQARDPDIVALEQDLAALLGLRVVIQGHGRGGSLTIQYDTLDQLDAVIERLKHIPGLHHAQAA